MSIKSATKRFTEIPKSPKRSQLFRPIEPRSRVYQDRIVVVLVTVTVCTLDTRAVEFIMTKLLVVATKVPVVVPVLTSTETVIVDCTVKVTVAVSGAAVTVLCRALTHRQALA